MFFSEGSKRHVSGTDTVLICPLYPQKCPRRKNDRNHGGVLRVSMLGMARSGSYVTYALRQLKSPLSNISSLGLAGLKSTGTFVIQGVTQGQMTDVHLGLVP